MNPSCMAGILESPIDMEMDSADCPDSLAESLQLPIKRSKIPSFLENSVKSSLNNESLLDNSKAKRFYQKLKEFNELHGISLARESVVGKALDLYLLYKEVTARGGFALVTKEGRWAEVVSALNFTSRVANTSIQLQHLYESLLYQFELNYCPGTQTKPDAASGTLLSFSQFQKPSKGCSASSEDHQTMKRKLQNYPSHWSRDSVDLGYQNTFPGANETEFESGYLVSAMVGAEKLNGLLYRSKYTNGKQFVIVPSPMDGTGLEDYDSESVGLQIPVGSGETKPAGCGTTFQSLLQDKDKLKPAARSSAKVIQKKGPGAPKGIRNAYQLFVHKECDRLKKIHGQNLGQNGLRRAIEAWNCLSENDRMPYIEESRKDKQRFDQEMIAYKERQKMQVEKVTCNPEPEPSTSNFQTEETSKAQFKERYHVSSIIDFQPEETSNTQVDLQTEETGNAQVDDGYHVKLQMEESCHKLLEPDQSMVAFAAKMMEGVEKLDASLDIDLGEFLSIP